MTTRLLFIFVFIAGMSTGWLGKAWLGSMQSPIQPHSTAELTDDNQIANATQAVKSTLAFESSPNPDDALSVNRNNPDALPHEARQLIEERISNTNVVALFGKLLNDRLYNDAMILYQEKFQENEQSATRLKRVLSDHLKNLSETRNSSNFSELIENYLSIYYDDIDILLLLADFNRANGSYLEAVDVYLLAKTYAYTDVDLQNVLARFNGFIKGVDGFYTNQNNWSSLINLYSHINALGLMTPSYQYQQALAYLGNGDEYLAIEQLNRLVNDNTVGESAAIALNRLTGSGDRATTLSNTALDGSEAIALQQQGNQYLVDLTINHQDEIKLLIDTGASITTLSKASFDSLTTYAEAIEQESRVFRTAGGVVRGTVYSVSDLRLGPYLLKDTQIAVLDFDTSRGFDGLLGMNVLGQFRFQIDQENQRLLLSRE